MNILVIGGGSIGKRHLKNLYKLGYDQLFCLKRSYDEKFEIDFRCIVIVDVEQLKNISIDCTFICSPTSLHNDGLKIATDLKCHIFMEKPLIHDREGLDYAIHLMEGYKNIFFLGFMLRFHPAIKEIKGILEENKLGSIYSARFEFGSHLPSWHPNENYKLSYAASKHLGGGVINTITHELDLIQNIFGNPNEIYCQSINLKLLDIDVEELCEAIFKYQDKIITLHLDYLQKDYNRVIDIYCENGKINWNWHDQYITVKESNKPKKKVNFEIFDLNQLYEEEIKVFFKLIKINQYKHNLDFSHAIINTDLMLKMHESNELNQKIKCC
jgi:predicted dehydrogenase